MDLQKIIDELKATAARCNVTQCAFELRKNALSLTGYANNIQYTFTIYF